MRWTSFVQGAFIRDLTKVDRFCCIHVNECSRTGISPWLFSAPALFLYSVNVLLLNLTIISTGDCLTTGHWTSLFQTFVGGTLLSGLLFCSHDELIDLAGLPGELQLLLRSSGVQFVVSFPLRVPSGKLNCEKTTYWEHSALMTE